MSLGQGHVKQSQGQNQMASHILDRIFSVQQGWYGTYLGLKVRILLSALVQFHQIVWLNTMHIMMSHLRKGKEDKRYRGVDDHSDQMTEEGNAEASG